MHQLGARVRFKVADQGIISNALVAVFFIRDYGNASLQLRAAQTDREKRLEMIGNRRSSRVKIRLLRVGSP